jgi:hypothetical protein
MTEEAIFLSASVPDPKRAPKYAETADSVAITAAVTGLVYVTLGRRLLVWGGHPAITPMIWEVARSIEVDYAKWVRLYQSTFFKDEFPEDNDRFKNVALVDAVKDDREKSLRVMREQMFQEQQFQAGVFIGGMGGVLDEFDLFCEFQPKARPLPVASTGGAAIDVAVRIGEMAPKELWRDFDYVSMFHRLLNISPRERRYVRPELQPESLEDRLWSVNDTRSSLRT